jgi:FixJ family two-component response regulator
MSVRAMKPGAAGFLTEHARREDLFGAIHVAVAAGRTVSSGGHQRE